MIKYGTFCAAALGRNQVSRAEPRAFCLRPGVDESIALQDNNVQATGGEYQVWWYSHATRITNVLPVTLHIRLLHIPLVLADSATAA
jgi:hypothetical protein